MSTSRTARIVVGVAGGIAAYKVTSLVRALRALGHQVDVVPTPNSLEFVGAATWEALSGRPVRTSVFEAVDTVNHVRLGQEADLVVIAPATADLLARAASGRAEDLLTATLLATQAQVVMAPAMHTEMWLHPATVANVATLRSRGVVVVDPAVGRLTGPDSGPGRLPETPELMAALAPYLPSVPDAAVPDAAVSDAAVPQDPPLAGPWEGPLAGRRVVVSAGGTREPLDPVRFLGNRSSGKQGVALAVALRDAGARVDLIAAHLEVPVPDGVAVHPVGSALELQTAVGQLAPGADALVMAAAVADFRPAEYVDAKIKKVGDDGAPTITLVRNPDVLAGVVAARAAQRPGEPRPLPALIVGFAAETGDAQHSVLEYARHKLQRKGCEILVVNEVGMDKGFATDHNDVTLLFADGSEPIMSSGDKAEVARAVTKVMAPRMVSAAPATVVE